MTELSPDANPEGVKAVFNALTKPDTRTVEEIEADLRKRGVPDTAILVTKGHFGERHYFERRNAPHWIGREWDSFVRYSALDAMINEDRDPSKPPMESLAALQNIECHVCGKRVKIQCVNPERYEVTSECPYPGGMTEYDVLIAVPSGRLAVANDLRDFCPIEEPRISVNYDAGTRAYAEAYAAGGMLHFCVGNTSPDVFRRGDKLVVANYADPDYHDAEDMAEHPVRFIPKEQWGEKVASVCTDLWWVSAMDADLLQARARDHDLDIDDYEVEYVDVPPGNYVLTIYPNAREDEDNQIFAVLSATDRIPPTPEVFDTGLAETVETSQAYREIFTPDYTGVVGFGRLEFLLTVIGNGYHWKQGFLTEGNAGREDQPFHKFGWDLHMIEVPTFHPVMVEVKPVGMFEDGERTRSHTIYPLSHYARIAQVPLNVDPWWLALCLLFAVEAKDRYDLFDYPIQQTLMRQFTTNLGDIVEARGGYAWIKPYVDAWSALA